MVKNAIMIVIGIFALTTMIVVMISVNNWIHVEDIAMDIEQLDALRFDLEDAAEPFLALP